MQLVRLRLQPLKRSERNKKKTARGGNSEAVKGKSTNCIIADTERKINYGNY